MEKYDKCPICGGSYTHSSSLYHFFSCGHAYEKPLSNDNKGKMVNYKSPYIGGMTK